VTTPTTPKIVITKPADDGNGSDVDKNLTQFSRRLIIENLTSKQVTLPLKVPKVFKASIL
jgi:hypothetical protein